MPEIFLPPKTNGSPKISLANARSAVIIGANGSGKSRVGAWIEQEAGGNVHRVGAQRALSMPAVIQPRPYEQAQSTLFYGHYDQGWNLKQYQQSRLDFRWQREPTSFLLNDFETVLAMLFAEESKRNREYTRGALQTAPADPAPKCNMDRLADIWKSILPHRLLKIGEDKLQASTVEGGVYEGRHMSDGERVAIYLIGQILNAPNEAIIVIDEPEIHIHRAIQAALWDKLEAARPDYAFVYITHDLEFAGTRVDAAKIWVKKYDGKLWEWEEITSAPGLPDALLFEVLGSRRPITFVEGDETSYDRTLYSYLYPEELVLPRQSCEKVIEATKALAGVPSLHHLKVSGIVDRDRRSDAEVAALNAAGVRVADVAEVENLLCLPEAIEAAAANLKKPDTGAACAAAKNRVLGALRTDLDQQCLSRALAEVQFQLNGFGPKIGRSDVAQLEQEMQQYLQGINLTAAVKNARNLFEGILATADYRAAMRFYNSKGIPAVVGQALGISKATYCQIALGLVKDEPDGAVANAMRNTIP